MPCDLTLRSGSSISSLLTLREASLPPVCGLKVLFSCWVSDTTANLRLVQNISYKSTWIYQYFHFRDTFHHFKSYYIKHVHSALIKSQRWVKPFSLKWKITYLYVKKSKKLLTSCQCYCSNCVTMWELKLIFANGCTVTELLLAVQAWWLGYVQSVLFVKMIAQPHLRWNNGCFQKVIKTYLISRSKQALSYPWWDTLYYFSWWKFGADFFLS